LLYDGRKQDKAATALRTALAAEQPKPSGYAYRYADGVLRLNDGSQFNGGWPVEAVPYWFATPALAAPRLEVTVDPRLTPDEAAAISSALAAPRQKPEPALQVDALRYRWIAENALAIDFVADPDNMVQIWHGTDPARFSAGKTLDEAVDAARRRT
jgi:hypothetical protein